MWNQEEKRSYGIDEGRGGGGCHSDLRLRNEPNDLHLLYMVTYGLLLSRWFAARVLAHFAVCRRPLSRSSLDTKAFLALVLDGGHVLLLDVLVDFIQPIGAGGVGWVEGG